MKTKPILFTPEEIGDVKDLIELALVFLEDSPHAGDNEIYGDFHRLKARVATKVNSAIVDEADEALAVDAVKGR